MKHRFLIRALACLLVLALPFSAMAEGAALNLMDKAAAEGKSVVATLTFTPGSELAAQQAVADMSAATKLQLVKSPADSMAAVSLLLSDEAVLSAQLRVAEEGLFFQTASIGEDTLFISWEDLQTSFTSAMAKSGMSNDAINSMMSRYQQAFAQGFKLGLNAAGSVQSGTEALTPAETEAQIVANVFGGDDSLVQWAKAVYARAVITEGAFPGEGVRDDATSKLELTLTQTDFVAALETSALKAQLLKEDGGMTEEQLTSLKEKLAAATISMPITVYKADDAIICAEADATVDYVRTVTETVEDADTTVATAITEGAAGEPAAEPETIEKQVPVHYDFSSHFDRLTTDAGTTYSVKGAASKDGEERIRGDASLVRATDGKLDATMSLYENGATDPSGVMTAAYAPQTDGSTAEMTFTAKNGPENCSALVFALTEKTAEDSIDYAFSVSCGTSVEVIKADANSLGGTLNLHMALQDAAGSFDKVANATVEKSVQPLKMTEDELSTFLGNVTTNAMQSLFTLIGKLPNSVLEAAGPLFNLQ